MEALATKEDRKQSRLRDDRPVTLILRLPRFQAQALAKEAKSEWTLDDWMEAQALIRKEALEVLGE